MRKPRLLVGVATAALLLGLAGPASAATSTYAASETGGDGSNVGATGAPDFDYGAGPTGLYTQLNTGGTSMTVSFAAGSVCLADSSVDLVVFEAGTSDPIKVTVNGLVATTDGTETPYSIGGPLNPDGTSRSYDVPAAVGAFTTVTIEATRTDPPNSQYAEIDAVQCVNTVSGFSDAHLWIGLKNSDDQGTQFDVKVELYQGSTLVASGLERCITGVTRNPSSATEAIVSWDTFPGTASSGDELSFNVSTRIGTNANGTKCSGPGGSHNNAQGLRLYYDSTPNRLSRFDITPVGSSGNEVEYLHSNGNVCANAPSVGATILTFDENTPPATAAKCKDSTGVNFAGGNPWRVIATWNGTP